MAKILLVEDDADQIEWLVDWLESQQFMVELARNGEDALQLLQNFKFDIVVLDWGLPGLSGIEVVKRYRQSSGVTPVLILTGRSDIDSIERGLESGADDYLAKPFEPRELHARINALLRRPSGLLPSRISIGNVIIEPERRKVFLNGNPIHLTQMEYAVLEFLMRHPNQIFGARALIDSVWSSDTSSTETAVRSCVKKLRSKIASADGACIVKTILKAGYTVEDSGPQN